MDRLEPIEDAAEADDNGVAVSDLIALYCALERARTVLDGATVMGAGACANPRRELESALIREERAEIDARMARLRDEIAAAPTDTRADAIQKLRFELMEYGSAPGSAEQAVAEYLEARERLPADAFAQIEARLAEIEGKVAVMAMALALECAREDRLEYLLRCADALMDHVLDLRMETTTPSLLLGSAA